MGSPAEPSVQQRKDLTAAAEFPVMPQREVPVAGGKLTTTTQLPRQSVVLLVITPRS